MTHNYQMKKKKSHCTNCSWKAMTKLPQKNIARNLIFEAIPKNRQDKKANNCIILAIITVLHIYIKLLNIS